MSKRYSNNNGTQTVVTSDEGSVVIQSGRDTRLTVGDGTTVTTSFNEPINAEDFHIGNGGVWVNGQRIS
jgi:hypothetical protein